jgi:hypothetical protein
MSPSELSALSIVPREQAVPEVVPNPDLEAGVKQLVPLLQFRVTDDASYEEACGLLKTAVSYRKRVEEFFAPTLRTANDLVKRVREAKATLMDPVEAVEDWLRKETARHQREATLAHLKAEQDRRIEDERNVEVAIAEAQAEGRKPIVPLPPPPPPVLARKVAGVAHRVVWKWRVKDLAAVPRDYMVLDEKLLNEIARTRKDQAAVPGIEFYADTTTSVS